MYARNLSELLIAMHAHRHSHIFVHFLAAARATAITPREPRRVQRRCGQAPASPCHLINLPSRRSDIRPLP